METLPSWFASMHLVIAALVLFVGYLLLRPNRWRGNPPPGPSGWPVVGSMFELGNRPEIFFTKTSERYGDVFRLNLGRKRVVVANSYETLAEAIVEKARVFADRPQLLSFKLQEGGDQTLGVQFTRASEMQRKKIKLVRAAFNPAIPDVAERFDAVLPIEVASLVQDVAREDGGPFDPHDVIEFCSAMSNVTGMLLYSKTLELGSCLLIDWLPWLSWFPSADVRELQALVRTMTGWHTDLIEEHRQTLNESSPRDFLDQLLIQQQTGKLMVSDADICRILDDLQSAGFNTATANILWGIQLLVQNPDVQKKLQAEIDEVVGSGRAPTTKDCRNMPYLEATLWEIQRVGMPVPVPGVRAALRDTTLSGYDVPKGTIMLVNQAKIATDLANFPQPHRFDPSRHLDENGSVVTPEKKLMLFGNGLRICAGRHLARDQMVIVMANLLQRFTFRLPDGATAFDNVGSTDGLVRFPLPYKIRAIPR
ncbi:PREDICTED: cytochrome P450 2U1-like [Priapulus caudatus]|uniref:Cytochrome P450 2U1-like n=1 Tax=Priapulus caudatus TaxID=37621 RepID=A0ABM1EPT9_PRICU|nr:PREDICTED: cytochrome P450 2U1-like [Priapulus caudatus]